MPLLYALPGHPKSGNIWEAHTDRIFLLELMGWRKVEGWFSVWVNTDGGIMAIYLDDFMLAATYVNALKWWTELGKHIEFAEAFADVLRYLGAMYGFSKVDVQNPMAARTVTTSMSSYLTNLVCKFRKTAVCAGADCAMVAEIRIGWSK